MKKSKPVLIITLITLLNLLFINNCLAKSKSKAVTTPSCTPVGEIQCPKGLSPSCPKQYKASCIFVGTMQLPGCLADSADNTFLNYRLDNVSCQKGK